MRPFLRFITAWMLWVGLAFPLLIAHAQDDTIAQITSPADNSQVSGQVQIIGTAAHPSLFAGYELEFDNLSDANEIWIPIGTRVSQQKNNEVLGIWDTVGNRVADGAYQLRLRVFLSDDTGPIIDVVQNIQVVNTAPTPLPSIGPGVASATPQLPPTEGPSPTPQIIQPPTNTPRPTAEGAIAPVTTTTEGGDDNFSFNFGSLRQAFCSGAYIAFGFFLIFGIYLALRAQLRPSVRQFWWQIRNEIDQDK